MPHLCIQALGRYIQPGLLGHAHEIVIFHQVGRCEGDEKREPGDPVGQAGRYSRCVGSAAGPTDDSDYSYEWPIETFQPWVDFAGENGMYVILDLQSGRDDFLSQAVQYEELLKLPHVGLALDPEWRLEDDQVHLEQIGSVGGAEVNQVIDWLGDLVRDNGLPQKMLIVHQFQHRMIVDRETIEQRPELQVVIQMDGQGPIPTKEETYSVLTSGTEDAHWRWGWKNFFDEDVPGPPSPASVITKEPALIYISYQ